MAEVQGQVNDQVGEGLRIDASERKGWVDIAFIRAGGMFSAPTLMVGAALGLGLALPGAALATLAGFGFIVAYMCFVSMQAVDLGLPTASLAAPALGRAGARYLVSLIVGVVTIGWFGVQTAVCGASLSLMLADVFGLAAPVWACSAALGALMLATAVIGFDGLKWVSSVAAPLLVLICLYGVGASVARAGSLEPLLGYLPLPADALGFIAGVNMAVGLFAFAGATAGDFARFARTRKDAVLSCVVGVIPAALVALLAGAALAIVTGEGDIARIMNSVGLPAVGLIALVLSAWTVNASNAYSAGLGFAVMLGRDEGGSRWTTAVSGLAGIALAVGGILGQFEAFLTVLSACGPALAGVMVADYWLVRKGRPQNVQVREGFSAAGVAGLIAGIAAALVTGGTFALIPGLEFLDMPFFIGPVNGIVASMAVYVLAYKLAKLPAYPGPVKLVANREQREGEAACGSSM
ncbi:cytosine permease [Arabiibacter massiliensis]|uniref:cytosine permease n=1 Tax=Arabiibacter massiliensis TaxID=1870985 RepID=UPI0009BC02EE|nr:cytosine permease [Arabiibacter massiliensis]